MTIDSPRIRLPIPGQELSDFCQRNQVKRLALFGSVLRQDFRSDSDVDILVLFSPEAKIGLLTLSRMKRELTSLFKRPVDLVPMDGLKPVIRQHILADLEEIYAA